MTELRQSNHAMTRLAQRGFQHGDIDLILAVGSQVSDGYLLLRSDVQAVERELKIFLARLKRLEGKRVVEVEGCLVTAYHATKDETRKLLRRSH